MENTPGIFQEGFSPFLLPENIKGYYSGFHHEKLVWFLDTKPYKVQKTPKTGPPGEFNS